MDGSVVVGGVIVIGGLVATAGWFVALKRGGDGYDHAGDHNASGAAAEVEEASRAGDGGGQVLAGFGDPH